MLIQQNFYHICSSCYVSHHFLPFCSVSLFPLSPPDALLADLENTGSPLARCPVLLTSDPPQNADAATEDTTQARPPPPAYTPQQVDDWLPAVDSDLVLSSQILIDLDRYNLV